MKPEFPFAFVPHKQYNNTFLQSVLLEFNFKPISNSDKDSDFRSRLENYLYSTFGLKLQENTEALFWKEGISISRKDNISRWVFSNGCVIANIGVKDYVSFVDSILPQAFKMRTFLLKVMQIDKVEDLHVRKINVWQFHTNNGKDFKVEDIRKSVFSNNLLREKTNCELDEYEKSIQNFKKIKFTSNSYDVLIRHLYKRNSTFFSLFLDTESILKDKIEINNIENKLIELNDILFNTFHWCVNKPIISIMEETNHE